MDIAEDERKINTEIMCYNEKLHLEMRSDVIEMNQLGNLTKMNERFALKK